MPTDPRPRYGTARYGQARYTSRTAAPPPAPDFPRPTHTRTTRTTMSDKTINKLNMISACVLVAQSPTHRPVWENQPPLDFGTDFAALEAGHADALDLAQRASSAITGTVDEKTIAETRLENLAYQRARALATHFRKTGDLTNRAKVNLRKSVIQKLRDQVLVTRATEIRDLAQGAVAHADAVRRGITAARITALTAALTAFAPYVNAARGQIVNRSALLRELETDVAALMDQIEELDDLVLQFDSEAGENFQAAWTGARKIVDAGHSPGEDEEPEPGNNPPTP